MGSIPPVGRRVVRWRVELTLAWHQQPLIAGYLWALIPTALILMGSGRRDHSVCSKTLKRIVFITWILRRLISA